MNKTNFVPLLLAPALFTSCNQTKKAEAENQRPSILFIMSDDHAYQAISAYDSTYTTTPNIDRIGNEGIRFNNACVTNSISSPSRAVILTGKHSHINGKINNDMPFDTTQVTFPQLFQKAGYQTAMFGKLHFGNSPKGFDEFMILPDQGDYINPDFITNKGDTTIQGYVTDIITDLTLKWFKEKRNPNKPFMMMYLHKAPHRNWWPKPEKMLKYSKMTFAEPATLFDNYENRGTAAKMAEMNILNHMKYSSDSKVRAETLARMGKVLPEIPGNDTWGYKSLERGTPEQIAAYNPILDSISNYFEAHWPTMTDKQKMQWKYQRYMQDYMATIESVDENVGRVLDYLDESGLAKNTIVVYTSDQGFYLGEHGWFDKRFMYNESFKTPLLIRWPNKIKPGITNEEMVQNLDFAQTFLEAAQIKAPEDMQGESLMPLLLGQNEKWTRKGVYYHFYEYPSVHMVKRHYGIASKEYKLIHFYYDVDEFELYDRKKDPMEMRNVINDPAYKHVADSMKVELTKIRAKYKDSPELDKKFLELSKGVAVKN